MRDDAAEVPGTVAWITGLSGAGKSTLAAEVVLRLRAGGGVAVLVDGDVMRGIFGPGLGHTPPERRLNADRLARMARFQWDDGTRRLALYHDDLVPKEEAALQSLNEGYVTGSPDASFTMLLESMRNLMQLKTEWLRAERDKHLAGAQLEFLLGKPW